MVVSIVLMSLGFVGMCLFIYGKLTNYNIKTLYVKTFTSLLFIALAINLFIYKGSPSIGAFVIASTILGTFGDVFLALKRVIPQKDKMYTILGMFAFMIGHIVLVVGLFVNYYIAGNEIGIIIPILGALMLSLCFITLEIGTGVNLKSFRYPAIVYIFLVVLVASSSLSLLIINSFAHLGLIIMFVGNVLFAASDMLLCRTYFGKPSKFQLAATTVCYYFAQFIIAFSLYFL